LVTLESLLKRFLHISTLLARPSLAITLAAPCCNNQAV
jgi:hypothetical protein